jgi:hypothetical protein
LLPAEKSNNTGINGNRFHSETMPNPECFFKVHWKDSRIPTRKALDMATTPRMKIDAPFADDAEVADMVARFEACTWPYPRWTHRAHLGVALAYLRDLSFDEALARARHHIPLYNRTCGDPDGYHDTITMLFMRRVARYLKAHPTCSLADAVEELAVECDIRWPLRYYSPELLWSAEARAGWVEPDVRPLDF